MGRIALLTPSITTRDAVSNDVLGMYDALSTSGQDVRIFAEGWTLNGVRVWPASRIFRFLRKPVDILIYHYSRGWDFGLELLGKLNCRRVIRYHNVTPPEYFTEYSTDFAAMCLEGRNQLGPIANAGCDLYLSASDYNMQELLAEGASPAKSFVLPPFHQVDRLRTIEPDNSAIDKFNDGKVNVCMVGRISPNKGHPALIQAFAAYYHDYNRASRLIIVGKEEARLGKYSSLLRQLVRKLRVADSVIFAGEVSDSFLKACYLTASVFMIASEHEGFCVPLVEAMALKVPIVAYSSSAIPDTLGGVGLVWEERDPYLLAESINAIAICQSVSAGLSEIGYARYEKHFTNQRIAAQMSQALNKLI